VACEFKLVIVVAERVDAVVLRQARQSECLCLHEALEVGGQLMSSRVSGVIVYFYEVS